MSHQPLHALPPLHVYSSPRRPRRPSLAQNLRLPQVSVFTVGREDHVVSTPCRALQRPFRPDVLDRRNRAARLSTSSPLFLFI